MVKLRQSLQALLRHGLQAPAKGLRNLNNKASAHQPHHVDRHVGALIRAKRQALGMSQTQLAEALGISFQQIQKYERGSNRISASKLYETAQQLKVPLSSLFEGLHHSDEGQGLSTDLAQFLGETGSHDLVAAFQTMRPALRKRLVSLARAMAGTDD